MKRTGYWNFTAHFQKTFPLVVLASLFLWGLVRSVTSRPDVATNLRRLQQFLWSRALKMQKNKKKRSSDHELGKIATVLVERWAALNLTLHLQFFTPRLFFDGRLKGYLLKLCIYLGPLPLFSEGGKPQNWWRADHMRWLLTIFLRHCRWQNRPKVLSTVTHKYTAHKLKLWNLGQTSGLF